jgi:hypothetical protein
MRVSYGERNACPHHPDLRTFAEGVIEGVPDKVHKLLNSAEQILTLGFAFDPVNVSLLFPKPLNHTQRVFATNLGAERKAQFQFKEALGLEDVHWLESDCANFYKSARFRNLLRN